MLFVGRSALFILNMPPVEAVSARRCLILCVHGTRFDECVYSIRPFLGPHSQIVAAKILEGLAACGAKSSSAASDAATKSFLWALYTVCFLLVYVRTSDAFLEYVMFVSSHVDAYYNWNELENWLALTQHSFWETFLIGSPTFPGKRGWWKCRQHEWYINLHIPSTTGFAQSLHWVTSSF
jgi:hypothetical protein